jgi:hypothetical protein
MAHFAKIENGAVTNVVVVDNTHEATGEAYLNGIGDTYNAKKDRFEPAKPYASWTWNEIQYAWEAPTARPETGNYTWDEETTSWIAADTIDVGDN